MVFCWTPCQMCQHQSIHSTLAVSPSPASSSLGGGHRVLNLTPQQPLPGIHCSRVRDPTPPPSPLKNTRLLAPLSPHSLGYNDATLGRCSISERWCPWTRSEKCMLLCVQWGGCRRQYCSVLRVQNPPTNYIQINSFKCSQERDAIVVVYFKIIFVQLVFPFHATPPLPAAPPCDPRLHYTVFQQIFCIPSAPLRVVFVAWPARCSTSRNDVMI